MMVTRHHHIVSQPAETKSAKTRIRSGLVAQKYMVMPNETDKFSFTWEPYFDCIMVQVGKKKSNVHVNLKIILKRPQMETIYFSNIHI